MHVHLLVYAKLGHWNDRKTITNIYAESEEFDKCTENKIEDKLQAIDSISVQCSLQGIVYHMRDE